MVSSSIALIQNLGVEIQRAQNKHQFRSVAYIAMALINLLLTISLCQQYGATGAAIGTAVSLILANGLIMNVYYHKRCNINIIDFWKSISRISIAVIPPIGIGIVFGILGDIDSIFELVIGIIVYSLIYMTSLWLCGFNSYEKQLFKSLWEGVIGKFKFIR